MTTLSYILHHLCILIVTVGAAQRYEEDSPGPYIPPSPVVGVLAHPFVTADGVREAGAFVSGFVTRFLQSAGVQVVALHEKDPSLESLLPRLSGVYLPDGVLNIDFDQPYEKAALKIYDYAKKRHLENDPFPLIGVCQGQQLLAALAAGTPDVILKNAYNSTNVSLPLDIVGDGGQMLGSFASNVKEILRTQPITYNNHENGVPPDMWERYPGLNEQFVMTSTSKDPITGKSFTATMESKPGMPPMYGIQFHAETIPYLWDHLERSARSKTPESLRVSTEIRLFIYGLFFDKPNRFDDMGELESVLIDSYNVLSPKGTGAAEGRVFSHIPDPTSLDINFVNAGAPQA